MFQQYFSGSEHLVWPLVGLLIFVAIFVIVLAFVFLGLRDKDKLREIASLPLADDAVLHEPVNRRNQDLGGPGQ
ncbi:hypothetical protein COW53_07420 [bacterium CG17_big_fil_post_rev_8_21_14_2_50_64_8]|nr:MAG: hypothetical protein COW53_07420 [bacterium CG17_big_fil_post_rev_8_21_14_2_50_64_8]PJA76298.1 MAG: hypothetical protein CO151_03035 [bacterium CG_4_9_14_3_um_filter_65_15]